VWRVGVSSADFPFAQALTHAIPFVAIGAVTVGLILFIAWVQAKATVYTVTSARVAMRVGAALTVTLNLPYTRIEAADLDLRKAGTGTIAFRTAGETKLSYPRPLAACPALARQAHPARAPLHPRGREGGAHDRRGGRDADEPAPGRTPADGRRRRGRMRRRET
jgi:hypothetical protein